jgi:hypothetical protein
MLESKMMELPCPKFILSTRSDGNLVEYEYANCKGSGCPMWIEQTTPIPGQPKKLDYSKTPHEVIQEYVPTKWVPTDPPKGDCGLKLGEITAEVSMNG